nr:MAG TPA: hypothetical protein [Caudoviricetes sp.]
MTTHPHETRKYLLQRTSTLIKKITPFYQGYY